MFQRDESLEKTFQFRLYFCKEATKFSQKGMVRDVKSFLSHIVDMSESCVLHQILLNYIHQTYKYQMKEFQLSPLTKKSQKLNRISNTKTNVSMPKIIIQIPALVKLFSIEN